MKCWALMPSSKLGSLIRCRRRSTPGTLAFVPPSHLAILSSLVSLPPRLVTRDKALWKLYHAGFLDVLLSRRVTGASVYGPTYITSGRGIGTLSYIWDTMLASLTIALLDPAALRSLIEVWLVSDMDRHYATDYLSGKAMGVWYAPNDMGILRCAHDYLCVTGDMAWLRKSIDGKPVLEHLVAHALRWKELDKLGHGLADYGTMENLLECVNTYIHEVASVNAGNVYGMRFVADLLERQGDSSRAAQFRSEAKDLASRINRSLYVAGKGWWKAGQPDGSSFEVRHCLDLLTVLITMFEDLKATSRSRRCLAFSGANFTRRCGCMRSRPMMPTPRGAPVLLPDCAPTIPGSVRTSLGRP